jgi:hypothetical protein
VGSISATPPPVSVELTIQIVRSRSRRTGSEDASRSLSTAGAR